MQSCHVNNESDNVSNYLKIKNAPFPFFRFCNHHYEWNLVACHSHIHFGSVAIHAIPTELPHLQCNPHCSNDPKISMKPGILTSREAASEMTEERLQDKIELKKEPVSPLRSDTMIGNGSAECANLILNKECTTSQPSTGNSHRNQRKSKPFKLQRKESIISRSGTLRLWSGNDESENMKTENTLNLLSRHCSPLYSIMFRHQAMKHFEAASDESGEEDEEEEEKGCSIDDREESIGNHSSSLNRSAEVLKPEQKSGYECGECELVADTRPSLKKHIAVCHPLPEGDEILAQTSMVKTSSLCPMPSCEFQTTERNEMEAHVANHVADGYSPTGKRRNGPISLQRVRYEREEYRCQICAYTCTIEKAFYKHLKLHSLGLGAASVKISCVICGKDRPSEIEMNKHMKKHREDRHFCCDICIFKTVQLKKLIQHRRMHTGEKPHLCPHCTYRSARRDNLRSHVRRVHKKENLFCDTFSPRNLLLAPDAENDEETSSAFSALVELEES